MKRNEYQAVKSFDHYLLRISNRLRSLFRLRSVAAAVFVSMVLSGVVIACGVYWGFVDGLLFVGRALLLISILGLVFFLWIRPIRHLNREGVGKTLEQRSQMFSGRAETYVELRQSESKTPFLGLLAKDALKSSLHAPVHKIAPFSAMLPPLLLILFILGLSLLFIHSASDTWRNGARQLWLGWLPMEHPAASSLSVNPGSVQIENGEDLHISAKAEGFKPQSAELHLKLREGKWQTIPMQRNENGDFDFSFYSVKDSLSYYVSAALERSEEFLVNVLTPPRIENISVEYSYPSWTGLGNHIQENSGVVRAVGNTQVTIRFGTDKPLQDGKVLLNNQDVMLISDGNRHQASFTLDTAGNYYISDLLGGKRVTLSESYDVQLLQDRMPTIKFTRPGRDWNASPIEEVSLQMDAGDDYRVEAVNLYYSVNGGDWQSVNLDVSSPLEHTFYLEGMAGEASETSTVTAGMEPGDLISYYAEVSDYSNKVNTDIMFVNVRPFDRQFKQSQQSGGQQGRGGIGSEQEISRRQREILVANWNLIRQRQRKGTQQQNPVKDIDTTIRDNALLLSELQSTLAEQAKTLARRSNARRLVDQSGNIKRFVDYLENAVEAMGPSARHLADTELQQAIKPQQTALQYLQRAEAVFREIRVSQQQNNSGNINSSSQDMAEMFELEMDLAKNQYEVPDRAAMEDAQQSMDDAFEKLRELASRQQKLSENARLDERLKEIERWQHEKLRRELEELKKQMESLAQKNSQNRNANQSANQNASARQAEKLAEKLQQALDTLQQLDGSSGQSAQYSSQRQQILDQARQQLNEALEKMAGNRQQELQQAIKEATAEADDLLDEQRETEQQLQQALSEAMDARQRGEYISGLSQGQERELGEQKRNMQKKLEQLSEDLRATRKRFQTQTPKTADQIARALKALKDSDISTYLGMAGDAIDAGMAPEIVAREGLISEGLRELRDQLMDAETLAAMEQKSDPQRDLAEIRMTALQNALRQMRQAVAQMANGNRNSNSESDEITSENSSSGNPQSARQDEAQQAGRGQSNPSQDAAATQGTQNNGQATGRYARGSLGLENNPQWRPQNHWNPQSHLSPLERAQKLETAAERLRSVLPAFDNTRLSMEQIQELQRLSEAVAGTRSEENDQRIGREYQSLLAQIEQLEISLADTIESADSSPVHTQMLSSDPRGYAATVSEYFRLLSEQALQP